MFYDSSENKPDKRVRLSRLNQTKLCDKKVNTAQCDWVTCARSTYMFCVAVTKIANCVTIAHSLCAVPAHWAMVTQISCAIVEDRVYSDIAWSRSVEGRSKRRNRFTDRG